MPTSPRSPFAAAADRLDRVVAEVKERQYAATGQKVMPRPPSSSLPLGDAWLRLYSSRTIRALRQGESVPPMPEFAVPTDSPQPRRPQGLPVGQAARLNINADINAGHIGAGLGKPGPKRGLLRRLFRGNDN